MCVCVRCVCVCVCKMCVCVFAPVACEGVCTQPVYGAQCSSKSRAAFQYQCVGNNTGAPGVEFTVTSAPATLTVLCKTL